jgi:hypothetical protein
MKKTTKAKKTTRTTKTTAHKKQKTLDSLSLADGKAEVEKVRELEQLLGVDQMNIFKTNNLEVFKEELSEMTLTDLQTLAAEAGVFPGGNKMALKNRLEKEFVSQTKGRRAAAGSQQPIIDPSDPKFEEVKKLMSEGL